MPEIADDRSIYAPDLPGFGESDAAEPPGPIAAAEALADLAADLRLRQIDVLGLRSGAGVALALARSRPDLVRRLVLIGVPRIEGLPVITRECLVLGIEPRSGEDRQWLKVTLPKARFIEPTDYADDLFEAAPKTLATQIAGFLGAKA